jgi:hypothetical protein
MKTKTVLFRITFALAVLGAALPADSAPTIRLENQRFRYVISSNGLNLEFTDRQTGRNYLRAGENSACASIRRAGRDVPVTEASLTQNQLVLKFGEAGIEARLKVEFRPASLALTVGSISGEVESLTFLNVPLAVAAKPDDPFGACALSLNLITRVDALPALQRHLKASAHGKYGLVGAKAAIVAAPMDQMLPSLQDALSNLSELPVCRVAGPWAREIPFNHGSYLFNFGTLTESNLTDWIEMTRRVGFTQIDNHGGGAFFRFGDLELNREKWPDGWDSFQRIASRLHDAGVGSILHTYAFFIDKRSKYVTPVPDPRLDAFRTFTLAEPLTPDAKEIVVNESTANLSTLTGFFEHNSVVLHLGNELVTFNAISKSAPWRFTGVTRGALSTRASAHERGASARHLKECFGLFVPNPESSLFEEIAANHAEVVNRCGFDGIYLDAIDGSSILRGGDECWYWANKFVVEIQKRVRKPVGMEMSAMWHHFWQYRTRWQAWDHPRRGHTRFIDLHAAELNGGLLLPLHLGWWDLSAFDPPQIEPCYPEVMEHVGARLIGWDAGISLTAGVSREALNQTPLFARAADILRTCEELRRANVFDEAARSRLRDPNQQFTLFQTPEGNTRFRQTISQVQTIALEEPWTHQWTVTNSFGEQPARFRIEALMSAASPADTNSMLLADLGSEEASSWKRTSAEGVRLLEPAHGPELTAYAPAPPAPPPALTALRPAPRASRPAAWAKLTKRFEPPLNAKAAKALGLEIEGDASGVLLAIRLESPQHLSYGAIADRYVRVDFTGRRHFTLVETESSRWSDYQWNDGKHLYGVYRELVNFQALESVSLWLQDLPAGRQTKIRVGPIRALPLQPVPVKSPRLTLNGQTLEFPVELAPGSWIEANGKDDSRVFGPKGEPLGKVIPRGDWPTLRAGSNSAGFGCSAAGESNPRARITVFEYGDLL